MRVYISGPIMYATKEQQAGFERAMDRLRKAGHIPVNPKDVNACPDASCRKLDHEIAKGMDHSWSCYLRYDLKVLLDCDAILMLPGWQDSHGARLEHTVAVACGLKVLHGFGVGADEAVNLVDCRPVATSVRFEGED